MRLHIQITKFESNNCFTLIERKQMEVMFLLLHKASVLDMVSLGNHALRSSMTRDLECS